MMYIPVFIIIIMNTQFLTTNAIDVTIFYGTNCDDSVQFFLGQFYPAYILYGNKMNVDLVPFGKSTADNDTGTWKFVCQHGPKECYGNKAHGCIIASNPIMNSTEFVVCTMKTGDSALQENLEQCALESDISWDDVQQCLRSEKGNELLVECGIRTASIRPRISFIPTIIFNSIYNESLQKLSLTNFPDIVDFLLDENECKNCQGSGSLITSSLTLVGQSIFLLYYICRQ